MLEKIDLERVFKATHAAGFLDTELYAETRTQAAVTLRGRIEDVRLSTNRGLALRCFDGRRTRHFFTHRVDTAGLLEVLAGHPQGAVSTDNSEAVVARMLQPPLLADRVSNLKLLYKNSLLSGGEGVKFPSLQYDESIKYFEVAHTPSAIRGGVEESAEFTINWVVDRDDKPERFKIERCSSSIESLFSELRTRNPLTSAVRRSLSVVPPWPAPRGEIPILWSARSLSKLQLQFLRAFEGDLVLGNMSFLTDLRLPISLPFTVEDHPDLDRLACDNEGSPRRKVTIFNQGRPKALACNNRIAEQLAVASTGHCRRQSFQAAPTVGFWNPRVLAHQTQDGLHHRLGWGLSVHDLDILSYDLTTGEIALRLKDCFLVHQGEEGEPIESVDLTINLVELLHSLDCFSKDSETIGLSIAKNHQRFITEVSTAAAMSRPLLILGSVPTTNYW